MRSRAEQSDVPASALQHSQVLTTRRRACSTSPGSHPTAAGVHPVGVSAAYLPGRQDLIAGPPSRRFSCTAREADPHVPRSNGGRSPLRRAHILRPGRRTDSVARHGSSPSQHLAFVSAGGAHPMGPLCSHQNLFHTGMETLEGTLSTSPSFPCLASLTGSPRQRRRGRGRHVPGNPSVAPRGHRYPGTAAANSE